MRAITGCTSVEGRSQSISVHAGSHDKCIPDNAYLTNVHLTNVYRTENPRTRSSMRGQDLFKTRGTAVSRFIGDLIIQFFVLTSPCDVVISAREATSVDLPQYFALTYAIMLPC